jgi:hypothetical protein
LLDPADGGAARPCERGEVGDTERMGDAHAKLRKGRLCTGKTRSQGLKQAVSATFPAKVHHGGQPCPTLPSADSASPLW